MSNEESNRNIYLSTFQNNKRKNIKKLHKTKKNKESKAI